MMYKEALRIRKLTFEQESLVVAYTLHLLALLYHQKLDRFAEAEEMYKEALLHIRVEA